MATADGGYLRFVIGQDGDPVPSGQLLVSPAGSTTPSPLFSDQAMTVAATNPLTADGTGFISSFYLTIGRYDFRYYDADGVLLYTVENVNILDYEEVTDLTLDLTTAQADILALEASRVLRAGDTMTGALRVSQNSSDALVNLEGNQATSMRVASLQDGSFRRNAGIRFDTPRSDTTDGATAAGRAVIKSMANDADISPRFMIATQSSGGLVSDGVTDTRNYNGFVFDMIGSQAEFLGNGTLRGVLNADFDGTPATGAQLMTRTMSDNRYTLSASDESLKQGIRDMPDGALETIKALTPRLFEFIESEDRPGTHSGLISQEVEKHIPSAIVGQEGRRGIDALTMIGILVKAFQELEARLEGAQ